MTGSLAVRVVQCVPLTAKSKEVVANPHGLKEKQKLIYEEVEIFWTLHECLSIVSHDYSVSVDSPI